MAWPCCRWCKLFSFIDRQALSLMIAPIKAELGMSDVQVSLVIGLGFALAYAVAGLPIGRPVDQWSRPVLLGLGFGLWSVCTAVCGFARSFGQSALFRSSVGIGEATLTPTVISFLGDDFPPSKRGISFGVFAMSIYVGSELSLVAGSAVRGECLGARVPAPNLRHANRDRGLLLRGGRSPSPPLASRGWRRSSPWPG